MNELIFEDVLSVLQKEVSPACTAKDDVLNDRGIIVPAALLKQAVQALKQRFGFTHLSAIIGQQYQEDPAVIAVAYSFWQGLSLSLHVNLDIATPIVDSIIDLIPGADFYERELAEMFGVKFTGRPIMQPLLLPDDWSKAPPMLLQKKEIPDE